MLAWTAEAIIVAEAHDADTAADRLSLVIDADLWDPVVIAVRAAPRFGGFIASQTPHRLWLQGVLEPIDGQFACTLYWSAGREDREAECQPDPA